MGDPMSVRQVMATTEYGDRVHKTEAVQDQAAREHFANEMAKHVDQRQSQVNEGAQLPEKEAKVNEDQKNQREEEKRRRKAQESESEAKEPTEATPTESEHIIDLQV